MACWRIWTPTQRKERLFNKPEDWPGEETDGMVKANVKVDLSLANCGDSVRKHSSLSWVRVTVLGA